MVLGHESAGIVHTVGSAVTGLKVGDRVAMEPGVPCRRCVRCKDGKYNLCPDMKFAATPPYDGTLARYYVLPEDYCFKLPENVSMEEGALIEPTAVAVHITRQAAIKQGDSVVVFGAGPVGLLCCAVAKAYGAQKIVTVDINERRGECAESDQRVRAGTRCRRHHRCLGRRTVYPDCDPRAEDGRDVRPGKPRSPVSSRRGEY
jgi:D-xylulose reductase